MTLFERCWRHAGSIADDAWYRALNERVLTQFELEVPPEITVLAVDSPCFSIIDDDRAFRVDTYNIILPSASDDEIAAACVHWLMGFTRMRGISTVCLYGPVRPSSPGWKDHQAMCIRLKLIYESQ